MNKKFLYLTKVSLRKKIKSKWFVITNIILAVAIILLLNINSIVSFFGGDFDSKTNIIVVDNNTNSYDLLELCYEANTTSNVENKKGLLEKVIAKIKILDFLLNLCYDKMIINNKKYIKLGNRIEDIIKYTNGWIKSIK